MAKIEEISSLGILEWVQVKSTLLAIKTPEYSCGACLSKYASRVDGAMMTEKSRSVKACREIRTEAFANIDRQIYFKTCPGNFVSGAVLGWLDAHSAYRRGVLPFAGGLMDQPSKVLELFRNFDGYFAERAVEQAKREAQNRARGPRGR